MSELTKFIKHNTNIIWINVVCLLFITIHVLTENVPELFSHGAAVMDTLESLALATISASIFYYISIFKVQTKTTEMHKKSLKRELKRIKGSILHHLLSLCRIHTDDIDYLFVPEYFYDTFNDVGPDRIMNLLAEDQWRYNEIKNLLKQISAEIDTTLNVTPFYAPTIANKLRHFKSVTDERIVLIESSEIGSYDNTKHLVGLLFEMFGGWSMIEGKTNRDFLLEAIEEL